MLWSDAWVLLAIIYAGKGKPASLAAVVAAADYIQHAVLVFEEMEGALARLTESGYVVFADGCLTPTDEVFAHYKSISSPRGKVLDELESLRQFIEATSWRPGAKPQEANAGAAFPALSRDAFKRAVDGYIGHETQQKRRREGRYVSSAFQESTLRRGKSLEQFLGGSLRDGEVKISWLELRPSTQGIEVWRFEVPDVGDVDFTDVYEFGADDIDQPVAMVSSPAEALLFAHNHLGASPERWVNSTQVGTEYEAFVKAGRPLRAQ